jgi:hypothetical protein
MLSLDQNGSYLIWALLITVLVLLGYLLYLRSRLQALRRRGSGGAQSARNANAAPPSATTAHAVSSANGPSAD